MALRNQIVAELPTFDIARFDKLETYALALSFTHAKFLAATQPPDDLDALSAEASKFRERLLAETKSLIHHNLITEPQLAQLKGAKGYKNIATDLLTLSTLLRSTWPQIQGKTPTTAADLETASKLATRLLRVIGLREQGPAQIAEATDLRLRAYTQLLVTYDDARRAVAYLRAVHRTPIRSLRDCTRDDRARRRRMWKNRKRRQPVRPRPPLLHRCRR